MSVDVTAPDHQRTVPVQRKPERRGPGSNSLLALGVRMGHAGGAEARARFVAVAGATALAVFVLLGLCAIPSAAQARADRALGREPVVTSEAERDAMTATRTTAIDGRLVRSHLIWSVVPGATPPPGVASLPGPGESLVSPALEAALETPEGAASRALFGVVVGEIGGDGLVDRGELVAYVGIEPPPMAFALPVAGPVEHHPVTYRPDAGGRTPEGIGAWAWVLVGLVVLSVPLHALVVAALRLGDRAQRRQLAALRLIGASRRDVRLIRAGALGPPALLGAGIAWLGFELARTRADGIGLAGRRWYPGDVEPSVAGVLAMVVVLGVVFAVIRRMVDETIDAPWQARRGWRPIGSPLLRAVPLALAAALFAAQAVLGSGSYVIDSLRIDSGRLAMHVLAILLATVGFATAGPSLIRVISDRIARRVEDPSVHVATRLAGADPVSVGRWSAVLATVVLLGGLAIAMGETTTDGARYWRDMPRGAMGIERVTSIDLVDALIAEVGEDNVAAGWLLRGGGLGSNVLVADCAALERVDPDLRGCGPRGGSQQWGDGSTAPISLTIDGDEVTVPGTSGSLTDLEPEVDHLGGMGVDVVADRAGVDLDLATVPPTVVFVRERDPRDRAAVLRVLGAVDPMASVESGPTVVERYRSAHPIDDRAAQAFLLAVGLVAMAGMVVALVDRGLAAARSDLGLVALGVRRRGRRRVVFVAAVLPVLLLVPLIGAMSIAAEVSWARVLFRPVTISGASLVLCAAVLAVTLVVALALACTVSSRATEGAWRRE